MTTPWKTAEDAFWTWLAGAVSLPATLKTYRSHEGKGLPFVDNPEAFASAAHMPALWLSLTNIEAENQGPSSVLDYYAFRGGLAWNVPQDARSRDTFEALVNDIRSAILGAMTAGVDEIAVSELSDETLRTVTPPKTYAPVLGYVWEFRLRFGYAVHHAP